MLECLVRATWPGGPLPHLAIDLSYRALCGPDPKSLDDTHQSLEPVGAGGRAILLPAGMQAGRIELVTGGTGTSQFQGAVRRVG